MITDKEIEAKAAEFEIEPQQVEKDYVHSWVLWALNSKPKLKRMLVLKGGNALRKGYFPDTRFSKDLDFSSVAHVDVDFLARELAEVCQLVEANTGVHFIGEDTRVEDKNLPFDADALEARIYFKGFYNEEKLTLKTQLDVTQFDTIYLPTQERPILHPYSDSAACSGTIACQKSEEILASKLTTLLHRRKAGDLFDLLYSLMRSAGDVNRREIVATFLKKSIFGPRPDDARAELLAIQLDDFRPSWTSLLVPVASVFAFDFASSNFASLINSLFDLATPALAAAGLTAPVRGSGFTRVTDFSFARGNVRSVILRAGRSMRMLDMEYSGRRRLVEPYRLDYYVRKRDGVGNEYFWGWDTTGGRSSGPGIKMFFTDKIRNASVTNQTFTPKYPVEF